MESVARQELGCLGFVHFGQFGFYFSTDRRSTRIGTVGHIRQFEPLDSQIQVLAKLGTLSNVKSI